MVDGGISMGVRVDDIYSCTIGTKECRYEVLSICYGIAGQEDLVEIRSLDLRPGVDTYHNEYKTMWVPLPLIQPGVSYKEV